MRAKIKRLGTVVVLVNAVVIWLHGQAHEKLGLNTFDWPGNSFTYIVIVTAPIIAMILLWTRWQHFGVWLLPCSSARTIILLQSRRIMFRTCRLEIRKHFSVSLQF